MEEFVNIKKKFLILLLASNIGFMDVNATRHRFGDLGKMTFPEKFTTVRDHTLMDFVFGPICLFLSNKISAGTMMSLNSFEMKKYFLINTGINIIVGAINFGFLLPRAASCPDRNNNTYVNTAAKIDFLGTIAIFGLAEYLCYNRYKKTAEYAKAADRFIELGKKERSHEENLEISQLLKKLIVTKETPSEDVYSFKSYGEKYQLIRDSEGKVELTKVAA